MKKFVYTIQDEHGIHVRPAGILAKEGKKFKSIIKINCENKESDITRVMSVMSMCIKAGETVTVTIEGPDEEEAYRAIEQVFEENL